MPCGAIVTRRANDTLGTGIKVTLRCHCNDAVNEGAGEAKYGGFLPSHICTDL